MYLHKLIPPRPTFSADMTAGERDIMYRHVQYWTGLLERGIVVGFGPVADPAGGYGIGISETATEQEARDLHRDDPAISSGLCTFEVYPMPGGIARGALRVHGDALPGGRAARRGLRQYFHFIQAEPGG